MQNEGGPVDIGKIARNEEKRTNLMVKNVPCRYRRHEVEADFAANHPGRFNFLVVPLDAA